MSLQAVADPDGDHEVQPRPDTIRSANPAYADVPPGRLLGHPMAYPLTAMCLNCGRPICADRWLWRRWKHEEP